jgi:branched-chain amino acid transport system substrate-binding protein
VFSCFVRSLRRGSLVFGVILFSTTAVLVPATATSAATSKKAPIQIAAVGSGTGAGAAFGVDEIDGWQLAVKDINDSGGVLGRQLVLTVKNDNSTPTTSQSIVNSFVSGPYVAMLGPTISTLALAALPIANSGKLPVISTGAGGNGIPQIGKYIHRVSLPETVLEKYVAEEVVDKFHLKTAAVIYNSDSPPAIAAESEWVAELQLLGVTVTSTTPYVSTLPDITPQLGSIKSQKPGAIFSGTASGGASAIFLSDANAVGITGKIPIIGNTAYNSLAVVKQAGANANGLIVGSQWSPSATSGESGTFTKQFEKAYGRPPDTYAAVAFNGTYAIKLAIEKSGKATRAGVQNGFNKLSGFDVLGAPVTFYKIAGGLRDATGVPYLTQVENGTFKTLSVTAPPPA